MGHMDRHVPNALHGLGMIGAPIASGPPQTPQQRPRPRQWAGGPVARVSGAVRPPDRRSEPENAPIQSLPPDVVSWPGQQRDSIRRLSVAQAIDLRARRAGGSTTRDIAAVYGVSERTVHRYLAYGNGEPAPIAQQLWAVIDGWRRDHAIELRHSEVVALASSVARIVGKLDSTPIVSGPYVVLPSSSDQ